MFTSNLDFKKATRQIKPFKLNLISLMDIFTILVFFLLLNSGDSNKLENAKFITLPDSSAGKAPVDELVILIGEEEIWLEQEAVVKFDKTIKDVEKQVDPLSVKLQEFRENKGELTAFEKENGLAVTIMGDEEVSFELLQLVMTICQDQDFRNISLAVNRIAAPIFNTSAAGAAPAAGG